LLLIELLADNIPHFIGGEHAEDKSSDEQDYGDDYDNDINTSGAEVRHGTFGEILLEKEFRRVS
jgi:hypothetical protein